MGQKRRNNNRSTPPSGARAEAGFEGHVSLAEPFGDVVNCPKGLADLQGEGRAHVNVSVSEATFSVVGLTFGVILATQTFQKRCK